MRQLVNFRLLLSVSFWIPVMAYAQSRVISGSVVESETKEAASFCHISLLHTSLGTVSDINGRFQIEIPSGIDEPYLLISYVGYKHDTLRVTPERNDYSITLVAEEKTLDEVVITGLSKATIIRENPVAISLISSKLIERTIESNIIDVLSQNVPGLNSVKTGPNISKPFIRGLGYNRVLTLYDGVRQEGQQWGDEHGIEVDAYNIEKAEVIKGPASLMFGSDALAGVVSLFPYAPEERDGIIRGRFVSEYQSNNGLIGNGIRMSSGGTRWQWTLSGSYRKAKNYSNAVDGRVYNTGYDEKNLAASVGYKSKKGFTNVSLTLYDNLQGIPDGSRDSLSRKFTKQIAEGSFDDVQNRPIVSDTELNSYDISPLHQHIQHYRAYVTNQYQIGKGDMSVLLGFQQNVRREYNHPTVPSQPGLFVRLNTINYGFRYNAPEFSNLEVSFGVNGMYQDNKNKDATDFPIPDFNLLDVGSYGFIKWSKDQWTVSGGVRYDVRNVTSNDFYVRTNPQNGFGQQALLPDTTNSKLQFAALRQSFNGVSLSIGTTYQLSQKLSLKVNVARGYRAPSIPEIASNGLDPGAHIVYIGNRNFVPEFSFQQDISINGAFRNFNASVSLFHNSVQDYIYLSQVVDEHGNPIEILQGNKTFQYQQGSAQLYGMETSLEIRPSSLKGLTINSNLAFVIGSNTKKEFENKGTDGQYLPFIPPLKIITSVSQEIRLESKLFPMINAKADIDYSATQDRFLALYNTETKTPGFTLFNAALGTDVQLSKKTLAQIQFQVNNVFDFAYQSNLSRLKYFEYFNQSPNGHLGIYSMGRNFSVKVIIPF
ncbi:MAG: TonB-dependent receptor [Cyclobacteriaceae bacterium]|nr:TonB-dependent receptor [Cyclobacteriaceae bacterium]